MYNIDGFNERTNYIQNSNNKRFLNNKKKLKDIDNSFVKMKVNENRPNVHTYEKSNINYTGQIRGNKENFVVRNYNINNSLNSKPVNSFNLKNETTTARNILNTGKFKSN